MLSRLFRSHPHSYKEKHCVSDTFDYIGKWPLSSNASHICCMEKLHICSHGRKKKPIELTSTMLRVFIFLDCVSAKKHSEIISNTWYILVEYFFFLCWRYLEVIAFHPTNYMHMEKTLFEESPWKSASEVIKMVWMSIIRALCNADMVTFSFRYHFSYAIWF